MTRTQRSEEYRRHRHRGAARRRGCTPRPIAASPGGVAAWHDADPPVLRPLGQLIQQASAYPGLLGIFARALPGGVDLVIVAPRPMTRAVRVLAYAWGEALRRRCPWSGWGLTVSGVAPPPRSGFCCLFWRPHRPE